jgi:hypothetical protein
MAVKKHGVHFDVTAENATDRALRAVEDNLGRVNKAAFAVGSTLRGAFVATAALTAGKAFATAAMEAERASARLGAVIRAAGQSAGFTKTQLEEMAEALSSKTGFSGEDLRNAEAHLLKFGNIHGEVFRGALTLSTDLAAFMGTDVVSAVQAVGKALNSPEEGLASLEKQIGRLDPVSRRWIQNLMDQGRTAEAQARVLELLRGKIGGTAEALNTGLNKAVTNVTTAWGDMLKAFGQTATVQSTTGGVLKVVENYLVNIRDVVENGDWVEKVLGVAALVGGAGGHRRFNLSKQGPASGQVATGRIGGLPPTPEMSAAGLEMMDSAVKGWREQRKKQDEEAKRGREKHLRDAQDGAEQQLALEEMAAQDKREAWEIYTKGRLEQEEQVRKARDEGMKAWFESIDREQEEAIEAGEAFLEGERARKEALKETEQAARDLGLTFASAFEDAVIEGRELSDVLRGLAMDVARIFLRKTVTEPLADAASGLFKGFDWGSVLPKFDVGTDYVPRDMVAMVHKGEAIIPAAQNRGGRGGGGTYYIDARGADREGMRRVEMAIARLDGSLEQRALGAVLDARQRGGSFASAFG